MSADRRTHVQTESRFGYALTVVRDGLREEVMVFASSLDEALSMIPAVKPRSASSSSDGMGPSRFF